MLTKKNQIRIIKHAQRSDSQAVDPDKRPTSLRNHRGKTKRDAVTVVTDWIRDLRRKKAEEATHGFQSLFGKSGSQLDSKG